MPSAPASIANDVSRELSGEHVLWAASPDRWAHASRYWANALFGIPFAAFAIVWTWQAGHIPAKHDQGFDIFFPLWGLMFVVAGLSMLLSPLWAAWAAGSAYYVVTERRAVIFERKFRLSIRSFPRSAVAGYERVSRGGRGGNIVFQRILTSSGKSSKVREIGFIGLPDFAAAERALDKLIADGAP